MGATADFTQQVAIWRDYYLDTITTASAARAAIATLVSAVEGESVMISSSFEGGSGSSVVVRDKMAMLSALQDHLKYLDPDSTVATTHRELCTAASWSGSIAVT